MPGVWPQNLPDNLIRHVTLPSSVFQTPVCPLLIPVGRGVWQAFIRVVTKSWAQLSNLAQHRRANACVPLAVALWLSA